MNTLTSTHSGQKRTLPVLLAAATLAMLLPMLSAWAQTAEIAGTKWNDTNGNGTMDVGEVGIPGISICLDGAFGKDPRGGNGTASGVQGGCTLTDGNGLYSFHGLLAGDHTVAEMLPPGSTNTTPMSQLVTLADGESRSVDFGNQVAVPPPPEVTVGGASAWSYYGLPVVFFNSPTTYTKDVTAHCGAASPLAVKLVIGPFSDTGNTREMMMTNIGGENWQAVFPPFFPDHGSAALTFYVDCPPDTAGFPEDEGLIAGEDEIQHGGSIYVDPSGKILNSCNGAPISGATVTLLRKDPFGFFVPTPPSTPPSIPAVNPQITGTDGSYGWVVIPGAYMVHAEHPAYSPVDSAAMTIPPAVTDLNLSLTPLAGCPNPAAQISELIAKINAHVATGAMNKGNGQSFIAKLNAAQKNMEAGDKAAAINNLRVFIKHVETFVKAGKLDAITGAAWSGMAQGIIDMLS